MGQLPNFHVVPIKDLVLLMVLHHVVFDQGVIYDLWLDGLLFAFNFSLGLKKALGVLIH